MSDTKIVRPLSPHLTVYRFRPTMAMSIVHRITGVALYLGTILVVWWLAAAASGEGAFAWASWFFDGILGRLILVGYTWALIHHMLGGIRHFVWDTGHGLSKEMSTKLAVGNLVASVALTAILWLALAAF